MGKLYYKKLPVITLVTVYEEREIKVYLKRRKKNRSKMIKTDMEKKTPPNLRLGKKNRGYYCLT